MKINSYEIPKSSFLGVAKDTAKIIQEKFLTNQNLLKLIYYNVPNWRCQPELTGAQIKELFDNKQISNVPQIQVDKERLTYVRLSFDAFAPAAENPYYRDSVILVKIVCHFQDWDIDDYDLRPYRIAGEIDSMLNGKRFSGIGTLNFLSATQDVYNQEFGGLTLRYSAVRGYEDQKLPK